MWFAVNLNDLMFGWNRLVPSKYSKPELTRSICETVPAGKPNIYKILFSYKSTIKQGALSGFE